MLPARSVSEVEAVDVVLPHDLAFPGFSEEAFEILSRLKREPHIRQYRMEKTAVDRHIQEPFRRYRDDIVVGFVLPNRLDLESERNVFSRLLKNDFGQGGCHHHYWMSFYRPGWTRLRDLQLIHSLHPEALYVGVSASKVSTPVIKRLREVIDHEASALVERVAVLRAAEGWTITIRRGREARHVDPSAIVEVVEERSRGISALRVMRRFDREAVPSLGPMLIPGVLDAMAQLWPLYRLLLPHAT